MEELNIKIFYLTYLTLNESTSNENKATYVNASEMAVRKPCCEGSWVTLRQSLFMQRFEQTTLSGFLVYPILEID